MDYLPFEQPIADLEAEIQQLEAQSDDSPDMSEKLREMMPWIGSNKLVDKAKN